MRDSPAPSSASSSVTDLYCTPHSSRSDLFLPGTAGDFSLSASLSACTLLYEVPSRTGGPGASERAREGGRAPPAGPAGQRRRVPEVTPPRPPLRGLRALPPLQPPRSGRSRAEAAPASSLGLGGGSVRTAAGNEQGMGGQWRPAVLFPRRSWAVNVAAGRCLATSRQPSPGRRWTRPGRPAGGGGAGMAGSPRQDPAGERAR